MIPSTLSAEYIAVQDYLFSLKARGLKFGIDRMRALVEALGHPERAVPVVHITGTNGKGSTAAMMDAIARQAGYRVGLYTSPHLVRLGERVQVDRTPLTDDEIVAFTRQLRPVAEALARTAPDDHPSFFEFMTAMAFLQFQRRGCQLSVIEVGLGGRLDATNVVDPEVSAITSISLDHCEMLGHTPEQIAMEKSGIIKPGKPVVLGRLPSGAERVARAIARERGCQVFSVREVFGEDIACYPTTNLEGDYQRWNAATATLMARAMGPGWAFSPETVTAGLQKVSWPGRWQRVSLGGRPLILDASHNPEGADVLRSNLERLVGTTGKRPVVITGALGAARAGALLTTIADFAKEIHLVVPHQARACSYEELEALIPRSYSGRVVRATLEELFPDRHTCRAGADADLLVITGSVYLLGEVLTRIAPEMGAGEGRLQDF
ncbi:MAG TPA: folylpolyglutamate synthase/dihydrofolate synthase family protein [Opitutaceae bacterium]|nr:folylpolyglutamate synthase/dihydrofolate synthase family protein [Opitutaceae bacterium]